MTPEQRLRHLNRLAAEHDTHVFVRDPKNCALEPCGSMHWLVEGELAAVVVSHDPVMSDKAYLVALHEIGHAHVQRKGKRMPILKEEALAWRWAIEQAQLEITPDLWAWLVEVLRNDLDNYATEHFALLKEAEDGSS